MTDNSLATTQTVGSGRWIVAIPVIGLGVTQILGYGTLYYAFAILEPQISRDFGWPSSWSFGCLSLALLAGGLAGPWVGRLIDRRGARLVMSLGSLASAIALVLLAASQNLVTFALALVIVEVTSVLVLYDAAFAGLSQVAGSKAARRAITQMTLLGGFASTVFWPLTHYLAEQMDWRSIYLIFALIHLGLCLPFHLLVLGRARPLAWDEAAQRQEGETDYPVLDPAKGLRAMVGLIAYFCLTGFVYSSFNIQWVSALQQAGFTATVAVGVGVLMGPSQVAIRFLDMVFGRNLHPLATGAISSVFLVVALAALLASGAGAAGAVVFATLFGLSQGLFLDRQGHDPARPLRPCRLWRSPGADIRHQRGGEILRAFRLRRPDGKRRPHIRFRRGSWTGDAFTRRPARHSTPGLIARLASRCCDVPSQPIS